jgi:hypothetical protein
MGDGAQFQQELPEGVAVETFTVIAYEDGRPTEAVFASTEDTRVRHVELNAIGATAVTRAIQAVLQIGTEKTLSDG